MIHYLIFIIKKNHEFHLSLTVTNLRIRIYTLYQTYARYLTHFLLKFISTLLAYKQIYKFDNEKILTGFYQLMSFIVNSITSFEMVILP